MKEFKSRNKLLKNLDLRVTDSAKPPNHQTPRLTRLRNDRDYKLPELSEAEASRMVLAASGSLVDLDANGGALEQLAILVAAAREQVALVLAEAVGDVEDAARLLEGLLHDRVVVGGGEEAGVGVVLGEAALGQIYVAGAVHEAVVAVGHVELNEVGHE